MMWIIILYILGILSEYLIYIVWHAIGMLALIGLQVISVVADGVPNNRRFIRMHKVPKFQCSDVTYKAPNITNPDNLVYFMADPPHLIETVRNAWYNSRANGTHSLVSGMYAYNCVLFAYCENQPSLHQKLKMFFQSSL